MKCLVCNGDTTLLLDRQLPITYHVCQNCDFIFKDTNNRISFELEHEEYKRHNNTMESKGYVQMFEELIEHYITPLGITGNILDFGSGPGPVLFQLLEQMGYKAYHFDPFYKNDQTYTTRTYQLITSTEVVEHFFDPMKEFKRLSRLLDKDGYLVIMTHVRNKDLGVFLNWWYRRDVTHVSFYHMNTFEYIAKQCDLTLLKHNDKNIFVFQKK